ncbi:hypothetical protein LCGC14_0526100 [marine sediment metagenome]|uniref:Uncharacterized protein n=1 Tax=marine sediment metagenome TaxID=412755 RepID=A0A0F9RX31_9ZZZZ
MSDEISKIESRIFEGIDLTVNNSFLAKGISPRERIIRYNQNPKVGFQYICAKHKQLSFESGRVNVALLPEDREKLLKSGEEMLEHGVETGRFGSRSKRALAKIVEGNHGEQSGILLTNSSLECFGLDTRLEINKLKYDGRGDGGQDAVIGLYGIDFKYRNDVSEYIDLVVSSYEPSPYCILVHTHSIRRKDDTNYSDDFYLNVNGSSHIVVIRGGISGARFAKDCSKFRNDRNVLYNSKEILVPVWDLVLFFAIQAAKQEGYIE